MAISSTTFRSLRSSGSVVVGATRRPPSIVATALPPWIASVLNPLPKGNDGEGADGSEKEKLRIPEHELRFLAIDIVLARAQASKDSQCHGVNRHDEHGDAEDKIDDQELGVTPGLVLTLKEVHAR